MAKKKVSKKITYFLIAVIVFGILPLLWKWISGNKPDNPITANVLPNVLIEKKENKDIQKVEKVMNVIKKKLKSDGSISADEISNLERDPFSITKEASQSIPIPYSTGIEGDSGGSGSAGDQTEMKKKDPLEGLELKGVLIDGEKKYALINDILCSENEGFNGMKVVSIKEGEIGLYSDGTTFTLRIKE